MKKRNEIFVLTTDGQYGSSSIISTRKLRLAKKAYGTMLEYQCECGELGTKSDLLFHKCPPAKPKPPTRQIIEACEGASKGPYKKSNGGK